VKQLRDLLGRARGQTKEDAELAYWRERRSEQGPLETGAPLYRRVFVDHFGLDDSFYEGKRLLDIGCGPRGSLTWAGTARERVGLDPLVSKYGELQQGDHRMTYVEAGAEAIPFEDGHFDVVSTINSLDHVEDVDAAISEITRVTRSGGALLLLVDVGHQPTPTEPHELGWDLVVRFADGWTIADRRDYERPSDNLYSNLEANIAFDHENAERRPGVLSVRFERR
jgi:ubiquinone/menaquinone biosynthesis C-methylase UbiE